MVMAQAKTLKVLPDLSCSHTRHAVQQYTYWFYPKNLCRGDQLSLPPLPPPWANSLAGLSHSILEPILNSYSDLSKHKLDQNIVLPQILNHSE